MRRDGSGCGRRGWSVAHIRLVVVHACFTALDHQVEPEIAVCSELLARCQLGSFFLFLLFANASSQRAGVSPCHTGVAWADLGDRVHCRREVRGEERRLVQGLPAAGLRGRLLLLGGGAGGAGGGVGAGGESWTGPVADERSVDAAQAKLAVGDRRERGLELHVVLDLQHRRLQLRAAGGVHPPPRHGAEFVAADGAHGGSGGGDGDSDGCRDCCRWWWWLVGVLLLLVVPGLLLAVDSLCGVLLLRRRARVRFAIRADPQKYRVLLILYINTRIIISKTLSIGIVDY